MVPRSRNGAQRALSALALCALAAGVCATGPAPSLDALRQGQLEQLAQHVGTAALRHPPSSSTQKSRSEAEGKYAAALTRALASSPGQRQHAANTAANHRHAETTTTALTPMDPLSESLGHYAGMENAAEEAVGQPELYDPLPAFSPFGWEATDHPASSARWEAEGWEAAQGGPAAGRQPAGAEAEGPTGAPAIQAWPQQVTVTAEINTTAGPGVAAAVLKELAAEAAAAAVSAHGLGLGVGHWPEVVVSHNETTFGLVRSTSAVGNGTSSSLPKGPCDLRAGWVRRRRFVRLAAVDNRDGRTVGTTQFEVYFSMSGLVLLLMTGLLTVVAVCHIVTQALAGACSDDDDDEEERREAGLLTAEHGKHAHGQATDSAIKELGYIKL